MIAASFYCSTVHHVVASAGIVFFGENTPDAAAVHVVVCCLTCLNLLIPVLLEIHEPP